MEQIKEQYWHQHVETWKQSGQTQKAYCQQQGLVYATFNYWRRKLCTEPQPVELVQVPLQNAFAHSSITLDVGNLELRLGIATIHVEGQIRLGQLIKLAELCGTPEGPGHVQP